MEECITFIAHSFGVNLKYEGKKISGGYFKNEMNAAC